MKIGVTYHMLYKHRNAQAMINIVRFFFTENTYGYFNGVVYIGEMVSYLKVWKHPSLKQSVGTFTLQMLNSYQISVQ